MFRMDALRVTIAQLSSGVDARALPAACAAVLCVALPLSVTQLASMLLGVAVFVLLQVTETSLERRGPPQAASGKLGKPHRIFKPHGPGAPRQPAAGQPEVPRRRPERSPTPGVDATLTVEVWKPSVMPVFAPTFSCSGLDAEVEELRERIAPTTETSTVVAEIASTIRDVVSQLLPGAEATGFVSAALCSGKAFGVAVPEVDIVVSVSPEAMANRLGACWLDGRQPVHMQKLKKSAVRACTDRLVSEAGFKFRRSAFRGNEPKVTMVTSQTLLSVPFNLYVNAVTPLYNTVLCSECERLDARAQSLVLVVRRWAKDRALCHTARGHLTPYAWTLLTIFFLQVGVCEGPGLLPPLAGLSTNAGLAIRGDGHSPQPAQRLTSVGASLSQLLKAFLHFYCYEFAWGRELVSVRLGARGQPDVSFPLHLIFPEDGGATQVGPSIEDPFEPSHNLGASSTAASLAHLREELLRAHGLCDRGASLSELLEPWAPESPLDFMDGSKDEQ